MHITVGLSCREMSVSAYRLHQFLLGALLLAVATPALSLQFMARVDVSQWHLEPSQLECTLRHPIPDYGEAVFSRRAGEPVDFYLQALANPMRAGKAALIIEAPEWKSGIKKKDLGYVAVKEQAQPIKMGKELTARILNELYKGMHPTFTRKSWYTMDETIVVGLSSVNFHDTYNDYLSCIAGLVPVSYEQISRSVVNFGSDQWKLTDEVKVTLSHIVQYIKADPMVVELFVDGHTDSLGRRFYNHELSQKRAVTVTDYMLKIGLPEDMITTRYHGERYPVAKNNSATGQAQNRRVSIRLEKDE